VDPCHCVGVFVRVSEPSQVEPHEIAIGLSDVDVPESNEDNKLPHHHFDNQQRMSVQRILSLVSVTNEGGCDEHEGHTEATERLRKMSSQNHRFTPEPPAVIEGDESPPYGGEIVREIHEICINPIEHVVWVNFIINVHANANRDREDARDKAVAVVNDRVDQKQHTAL